MARRRSLNRRWSRKSLNVTELDQDSEIIDTDKPLWWENIAGDITARPSLPLSVGETTGPDLDSDSRIEPSELQDHWWDNLDRTKLSSSRRFSTRKSLNPGDSAQESFVSEADDDVSIKKKKILLGPRANKNKSSGNENFMKVFNESNVTAQSEPVPGKRKSNSPTRSDTEVLRKKTRTRRSQAVENSHGNLDDASFTSNDTDILVKPRPKVFKKRFTTKLEDSDDAAHSDEAGPSGINGSKNARRFTDSPSVKDRASVTPRDKSNESGLMGPPKSASHRKRLSQISRKLNLTSDESESDAAPKRARAGLAKKSRQHLSINPFDEILSGHLEEEATQSQRGINKSAASAARSPNKSSRRESGDQTIDVSLNLNEEEDQISAMDPLQISDSVSPSQVPETQKSLQNMTVDLATTRGEETGKLLEDNRRSIVSTREMQRVSKSRSHSRGRSTLLSGHSASDEQLIKDLESSADEELGQNPSKSMSKVAKRSSSIKKSLGTSAAPLSSTRISYSQRIEESEPGSAEEEEMVKDKNQSQRSAGHSRTIADSAYELPDKERSDSPIISMSESENDKIINKSMRHKREKKRTRESANRSISHEKIDVSRKSSARMNASSQKIDSDESISGEEEEEAARSLEKSKRKSTTKRDSHVNERASTSRKSAAPANASRRQTQIDDIISEDEVQEEAEGNSKSASVSVKEKSNTARKSTSYGNTSRKLFLSEDIEETSDEEVEEAEKSKSKSIKSKRSLSEQRNLSRQPIVESGESISEEELEDAHNSNSKSTRRTLRGETRNSSVARNSSQRADVSGQGVESNDAGDAANSKSASSAAKRKANVAGNSSANVSAQQGEIEENFSEEDGQEEADKTNSKSANLSAKRKISTARKSIARGNVSSQRIEASDESSIEEEPEMRNSTAANLSASRKSAARGNVSHQHMESYQDDNKDGDKSISKLANLSTKRKISTARKSMARVSEQQNSIESEGSEDDEEDAENMNQSTATENKKTTASLSKNSSIVQNATNATNRNKSTLFTAEDLEEEEDSTTPSEAIPLAAELIKLPNNNQSSAVPGKINASRTQKNITDFFQSKFLQKSDHSGTLELTSFDHEKLNLIRQEMEKIKKQEIEAMKIDVTAKKKEPSRRPDVALKALKRSRSKENVPKAPAKPAKPVDKAFIVNGTVYKRPKLPKPKPWVTDRLYHHLWKKMEPKFGLSTRIKSEKFVVQLSEVVAITIRRKKYDSYKLELDLLMKEMAKLDVIKTRNDFYDFCYDFLPYDFRVKATPILLPGNVRTIPYDPETLDRPILANASRSG